MSRRTTGRLRSRGIDGERYYAEHCRWLPSLKSHGVRICLASHVSCVVIRVSHADRPEGDRNLAWWGQATECGRCAGSRTGAAVKPACAQMCEEARSFLRHEICPTRLVAVWLGWTLRHGTGEFVREKPRGPKEVTKNSREGMLEAAKVGSIARNERGEYDGPGG